MTGNISELAIHLEATRWKYVCLCLSKRMAVTVRKLGSCVLLDRGRQWWLIYWMRIDKLPVKCRVKVACEQALLFGRAKRAARGRRRSRVSSHVPLARVLFTISLKRRACSQAKSKRREYLSSYRPILWSITNDSRRMCPVRCRLYEYESTQFLYSTETQPILRISRTGDRKNKQCKIKRTNNAALMRKEGLI